MLYAFLQRISNVFDKIKSQNYNELKEDTNIANVNSSANLPYHAKLDINYQQKRAYVNNFQNKYHKKGLSLSIQKTNHGYIRP